MSDDLNLAAIVTGPVGIDMNGGPGQRYAIAIYKRLVFAPHICQTQIGQLAVYGPRTAQKVAALIDNAEKLDAACRAHKKAWDTADDEAAVQIAAMAVFDLLAEHKRT